MITVHRKYLFNKINIIVVLCLVFITIIGLFLISNPFTDVNIKYLDRETFNENYLDSFVFICKFTLVILAIFLFGSSFSRIYDSYKCYLINKKRDRLKYFISKIFVISVYYLIIAFVILIIGLFILILSINWKVSFFNIGLIYLKIVLYSYVYGLITIILINNIDSIFIIIIPIVLFILNEVLIDMDNTILNIYNIFIPVFNNNIVYSEYSHLLILSILYLLISSIMYYKKG